MRFRTSVDYREDDNTVRGSIQAIQEFEGDTPNLDGTQMMVERMWQGGNGRAVYHDNLGDFNDLFQLFSDFKTEREKIGVSARHAIGGFNTTGVVFTTETEDVESEERGAAARLSYGDGTSLLLGSSITYRKALEAGEAERKNGSHAISADLRYATTDSFSLAAQVAATDDDTQGEDYGGGIKGEYDLGPLRLSTGYTDLGENFKADFADPLHNVERDARGFDAGVDYFMLEPIWFFSSFSSTLHVFNLARHSDDSTVEEIDGSLRFGIGERDSFFMSVFRREDEYGRSTNYMASATHKWNEVWTNRLQTNYAETDESDSLRLNVTTTYNKDDTLGRLSLEWSKRDIYYSKFSPYEQSYVRFDLGKRFWHLQIQGRYTDSGKERGINLFGRLDYKPLFWHRYQIVTYLSLGNRSAVEIEKQIEIGIEVQF